VPEATKEKITISIDKSLLEIIDRQRGNVKRSTYINHIISQYFMPTPPEEQGGGTFVTTLELRKTLKNIHERLKILDALALNVKDLESVVYENLLDTGTMEEMTKGKRAKVLEIHHGKMAEILSQAQQRPAKGKKRK